jgi:hypothetical protein
MHWLATHWPFRALHALVAQVAFEVQDEPTEQFEVHWHTPPAWQTPLGHEFPAVTFPQTPFWPPVNAARQLWQLFPLQAVLQHTPEEQLPEAQFAPVEHATPFWPAPSHTPLVQTWPDWHATPQAPQLLELVCVFTHCPPQRTDPVGQEHWPFVQIPPPAQTFPQPPQLFASLVVLVQVPLQLVVPAEHTVVHAPLLQVWPLGQAVPQAPQLLGSLAVLTHCPAHRVAPPEQPVCTHAPPVQAWPEVQACPHPPQLAGSLEVLTQ